MSTSGRYELTSDPLFYAMLAFFALLTTLLPGALGQPNFLPIAQALALTIFLAVPLRRGQVAQGLRVLLIWLGVQILSMAAGSALLPVAFERAIPDGFALHTALVQWAVTGQELPGWLLSNPLGRVGEVLGVLLGSLFSAGLVGLYFFMRAVNQFAYALGRLTTEMPTGLLLGLFPWRLVTFAGYAGFVLLLAQPLLTNRWNPAHYLQEQNRLLRVSALLLAVGLLLELLLPGLWRALFAPR